MFSMAALVGFIIAAPFYISLQEKEDSIAAWNGDSYEINLNRYPSSFFIKPVFQKGYFQILQYLMMNTQKKYMVKVFSQHFYQQYGVIRMDIFPTPI